jgi:hypothetical protein
VSALGLVAPALLATPLAGEPDGRIEYRLDARSRTSSWRVSIEGSGFAGATRIDLELEDWGEWLRLDDYYLRVLECEPALRRGARRNEWYLAPEPGWDGRFSVRYELAVVDLGSPARAAFGALPYRAEHYARAVSANTLMDVSWEEGPERAERTLALDVPPDWTVVTGWGGTPVPAAGIALPEGESNTLLSFGRPRASARLESDGLVLEVTQWGGETDVAAPLADFARTFLEECSTTLRTPPSRSMRLVMTEPGHGGTHLDGVIELGVPGGLDPVRDAGTLHFVAHELFHEWLGGKLRAEEGERMAWFWEGFTEYLSLWHLARAELVPRDWFATRLLELEGVLVERGLFGTASLADPAVDWRDPAREPLAYQGSALTAFALDVALRAEDEPGLVALVRDLLAREGGRYSLDVLRDWVAARGLAGFWDERFAAPVTSTLGSDLAAAGFVTRAVPQAVAYVGVRLDRDGPFGTVVAVDPEGPSAGKVAVGDVVSGLAGTRVAVPGAEAAAPEYPFGLAHYDPEAAEVRIDVERGSEHLQIHVSPRRIPGPPATVFDVGPELAEFFR